MRGFVLVTLWLFSISLSGQVQIDSLQAFVNQKKYVKAIAFADNLTAEDSTSNICAWTGL